jgi:hypothetical protein
MTPVPCACRGVVVVASRRRTTADRNDGREEEQRCINVLRARGA